MDNGGKTIMVDMVIAGFVSIAFVVGSGIAAKILFGETAGAGTMIAGLLFAIWYLTRGVVKYYYVHKYDKQGWTRKRRNLMFAAILLGPLLVFLAAWILSNDHGEHLGFSWK